MTRRKTDAEFRKEVKALVGDEYSVIGSYVNSKVKIQFKHNKCGSTFAMQPNSFLCGTRCSKCMTHSNRKKTDQQFKEQVRKLVGNEYTVFGEYRGDKSKLKFKHNKCQSVFLMTPHSFLAGHRCSNCYHQSQMISNEEFEKRIAKLGHNQYQPLQQYQGSEKKILILHKKCGHKYYVSPRDFLYRKRRCPFCKIKVIASKNTIPFRQMSRKVSQVSNNEYKILFQKYNGTQQKALFYHKECKKCFEMKPSMFFQGNRCPFCRASKGEKAIENYFNQKNINFRFQFRISKCRDKRPLPFDFAVFNKNKTLNCLIEYQGEQHFYNPFNWNHKGKTFTLQSVLRTQKHDAMKLQYCKDHGIKLIRINHPQTSSKSNSIEFIERLVKRTLDKELKVS